MFSSLGIWELGLYQGIKRASSKKGMGVLIKAAVCDLRIC